MDPLTIAGASVAGTWLWDKYGKELMDKISGSAQGQWSSFKERRAWNEAAERYRLSLQRQYSFVRLIGKSQPVELEDIFADVYILDEITARQRYNIEELKKISRNRVDRIHDSKRINGIELIKRGGNFFILGKPGAGKTTFLKYITLQVIKGRLDNVPIFISLKEWADSGFEEIIPFMVKQFEICGFPEARIFIEYLLESGRAIVFFDGLDEVLQEKNQRSRVTTLISNLSKQYFASQFLVTCRIAATDYAFENFQDVEIADFTYNQIDAFVKKWFNYDQEKYKLFISDFNQPENKGLKELASIPLLLTLLCLSFEANLSFPHRRAELYEDALDALLRRWDTTRNIQRDLIYRELSLRLKQRMFAHIAAATFDSGNYFIPQRELEKRINAYIMNLPNSNSYEDVDALNIIKSIESQHSIIVERSQKIYSFSHLTFQEYYTARYIAENEARGTTERLIDLHLHDSRWKEVFLLTSSLLDEADDFLQYFSRRVNDLISNDINLQELLLWANKRTHAFLPNANFKQRIACINHYISIETSEGHVEEHNNDRSRNDFEEGAALDLWHIGVGGPRLNRYFDEKFIDKLEDHSNIHTWTVLYGLISKDDNKLPFDAYIDYKLITVLRIIELIGRIKGNENVSLIRNGFERYVRRSIKKDAERWPKDVSVIIKELHETISSKEYIDWKMLRRDFQKQVQSARDIGYVRNISSAQSARLLKYMKATVLLVNCLEVAGYSSNRSSIESMLFTVS